MLSNERGLDPLGQSLSGISPYGGCQKSKPLPAPSWALLVNIQMYFLGSLDVTLISSPLFS